MSQANTNKQIREPRLHVISRGLFLLLSAIAFILDGTDPTKSLPLTHSNEELSSFWGIDLDRSFPEWQGSILSLRSVYEGHNRLIARVAVTKQAGDPWSEWDVDLFSRTKTFAKNLDGPSGMQTIRGGARIALLNKSRVTVYERRGRGSLQECSDPIQEGYQIISPDGTIRKTFFILGLRTAVSGYEIGGNCDSGSAGEAKRKIRSFVEDEIGPIFPLHDGSLLTGILGRSQHRAIWRFTGDFQRPASLDHHLVVSLEEYNSLIDKEGLFGAQSILKSKLETSGE